MKDLIKKNYLKILLGIFLIFWIILAINPVSRSVWAAENILVVIFIILLITTHKKFRFTNLSYTLFFIFLIVHVVGSYYTYTGNLLFEYFKDILGLERNPYDRFVHFLFGALFFIPFYEIIFEKFKAKKSLAFLNAFFVIGSLIAIFEVFEWLLVEILSTEVGNIYLAMNGDVWDTQKDMFLGMLGAVFTWILMVFKNGKK
jgi:putative membrane protein